MSEVTLYGNSGGVALLSLRHRLGIEKGIYIRLRLGREKGIYCKVSATAKFEGFMLSFFKRNVTKVKSASLWHRLGLEKIVPSLGFLRGEPQPIVPPLRTPRVRISSTVFGVRVRGVRTLIFRGGPV